MRMAKQSPIVANVTAAMKVLQPSPPVFREIEQVKMNYIDNSVLNSSNKSIINFTDQLKAVVNHQKSANVTRKPSTDNSNKANER